MSQESLFPSETLDPFGRDDSGDEDYSRAREALRRQLAQLRQVEGFPAADDETIVNLSLPPRFTACPNPFLSQVLTEGELQQTLERPPRSEDVSAGKNDPLYFAHSYSTKVPHQAIIPYILDFTNPGEVVFDGFCGTGMTGVAAQLCEHAQNIPEGTQSGRRVAVLSDLSPAATFIASMTNSIASIQRHSHRIARIIEAVAQEHSELLETAHTGWPRGTVDKEERVNRPVANSETGQINYVVWSDIFVCPSCSGDVVYWDLVFRGPGAAAPDPLTCPHCSATVDVRSMERKWRTRRDEELNETVKQAHQVPVLINYSIGKKRFEKHPDEGDLRVLTELEQRPLPVAVPTNPMPEGVNTAQPRLSHGFSHVHHFFTRRNLLLLGEVWNRMRALEAPEVKAAGLFVLTGAMQRVCRLNRYMPSHDRHVGPLSGTLYISQLTAEIPATDYLKKRIKDIRRIKTPPDGKDVHVSTQSATDLKNIPSDSVDYIFTDPPFGGNINYSELNILVECWLGVQSSNESEAVVNEVQQKGVEEYRDLMAKAFEEFHRILRPGRYITVEFHNSQNAVWAAIQEAMWRAGFVISYVRTIDKKKGTTKQLSYSSTVKQDLVITAYKPEIETEISVTERGSEGDGMWSLMREHLSKLPLPQLKGESIEAVSERQKHLLFDRMVAFYVQRQLSVPASAAEFYEGLSQRFPERDSMYFLPEQVAGYDRKRAKVSELKQLDLFVNDEASAIQWIRQELSTKPQTFQDLQPEFMQKLQAWAKHERTIELKEILEQNFLRYDGEGPVPSQIHSYLSTNYKDLRNLEKDDPRLVEKAEGRWYVPDPNKQGDLEKLRERALLKEFEQYKGRKKKLKEFRTEAIRAGFKAAYDERDYETIVSVAKRLPESVLQEDEKLLMYYDVASMRLD